MARFTTAVFVLFAVALASTTVAAPAPEPQAPAVSAECTKAREIAKNARAAALQAVEKIPTTDPKAADAVNTVKTAFGSVEDAVNQFREARSKGQLPAQSTIDQIRKAWSDAESALGGLGSADTNVANSLQLVKAAHAAGLQVKGQCAPQK